MCATDVVKQYITLLENEEFEYIYENRYAVSNQGRVFTFYKYRLLKPEVLYNGYLRVALCVNKRKQRFRVHRLVAVTFISPKPEGMEINHINAVRDDNRAVNLEWCTHADNNRRKR